MLPEGERMNRIQPQITEKYIEIFRKILMDEEKSQNTIEKYIRDIRKFQVYAKDKKLNKEIILSYKMNLQQCGRYQIRSINSYLVSLNRYFQCMGCKELCVKTIKVQHTAFESEEKELTKEEYCQLVKKAIQLGDETTALILQTIASTGIRIGELSYIRIESLKKGSIDIHNKGKVRRILLPSDLIPLLEEYAGKKNRTVGSVFCNRKGNPIDRKTIWRRMKKIAALEGISQQKVYPHNLRHLFAKEFYKQTGDIMKLADILGHSNINTTRIYIRTAGREHKEQLDAMGMVLIEKTNNSAEQRRLKQSSNQRQNTDEKNLSPVIVPNVLQNTFLTEQIWLPALLGRINSIALSVPDFEKIKQIKIYPNDINYEIILRII